MTQLDTSSSPLPNASMTADEICVLVFSAMHSESLEKAAQLRSRSSCERLAEMSSVK